MEKRFFNLNKQADVDQVLEILENSDLDFSDDDDDIDPSWKPVEEEFMSDSDEENNVVEEENNVIEEENNVIEEIHLNGATTLYHNLPTPRRDIWKNVSFINYTQPIEEGPVNEVIPFTPMEYFLRYFSNDHFNDAALFTKMYSLSEHGNILKIFASDIKKLYGCHIVMGCIRYPRVRMYWSEKYGVECIKNAFTRDTFFNLRNMLHLVDVNQNRANLTNKLWKIQPIIDIVRSRCNLLSNRIGRYSIDEQMIPFTGRSPLRQFVKNKPRPVGLKNFVVATFTGLVVDFEIYQGAGTVADTGIGLGPSVVIRLTRHLIPGSVLYFDRYFTTLPLLEKLNELGFKATGTILTNRLRGVNFPSDRSMMRGDVSQFVKNDLLAVVKWKDSKCVVIASSECGKDPIDKVSRWCKKEKKYLVVNCPEVIKKYNKYMGGVDLADQSMEYYRIFIKTKKWTVKAIFHLVDMAITNSWREYVEDAKISGVKTKDIKDLLKFKLEIGEALCASTDITPPPQEIVEPLAKKYRPIDPVDDIKFDRYDHWPESVDLTTPRMCRYLKCQSRTRTRCVKCNVFLCISSGRSGRLKVVGWVKKIQCNRI